MAITEEQFRQVQAANPGVEIEILQHDELADEIVVRVPTSEAWYAYLPAINGGKREADRALVQGCALLPSKADVGKLLDSRPAIAGTWAPLIAAMAGFSQGATRADESKSAAVNENLARLMTANPGVELKILQHDVLPDEVIARVPTVDVWTIYENLRDAKKPKEAVEALIGFCVLFPGREELSRSFEGHPALAGVWAGEIVTMAGWSKGAKRKKF